ncbi:MAG TPA: cytochrome c-type biogenesis CcmF C-terminal domain-containing protein, partial [Solirubrobacterales bacterium]|nr:cytochrome c-type biogenesis CcmF C-terminal domain-containing protein [Solirubrobacterales bacterium]
ATTLVLAVFTDAADQLWALALFAFAAFALTGLAQEFWLGAAARRRLSGEATPQALVGLVSRNRRRYGGYIVHAGIAILLVGVAASSSFQTNRDLDLRPGESTVVDGRTITYEKPTVALDDEKITLGSLLRIEEDGEVVGHLRPSQAFFRPTGGEAGMISTYFAGEATSEVGLRAGLGEDLWIAERPNVAGVQRRVRAADKGFEACVKGASGTPEQCKALGALMRAAAANPALRPQALEQVSKLQGLAAENVAQTYLGETAPSTFKVIVNPLVTWMWIGGLIALAGALIAIWPTRGRRRGALVRTEADARKEAKYREIRDAELDHAVGKLSDEDFNAVDAELREEALEILDGNGNGNGNGSHPREPEKIEQG